MPSVNPFYFYFYFNTSEMKKITIKFATIILLILFTNIVISQNKSTDIRIKKDKGSSHTSISLNYISDAIYMGRKDSISAPYLYPSITYYHKSGFYANGSLSFLTKSNESRIDLFLLTAGFEFTIKKFDGDISVTKYFFNEDSYNIISEVQADLTAAFSYDLDIINLALAASTYFNNNSSSDFFLSSEISHDFISSNNKFQISPTVGVQFGSQNFYEEYYMNNRLGNGQRGSGNGNNSSSQTATNVTLQESEKFNLMAVELSLPIWYVQKPFIISFLPTLVFPQNEATIVAEDTIVTEKLEETFYWMIGLSYQF